MAIHTGRPCNVSKDSPKSCDKCLLRKIQCDGEPDGGKPCFLCQKAGHDPCTYHSMRLLKQLQDQRITDFDTVYPLLQSVMDRRRQNHLAAARFGRGCDLSGSKQAKPDADGPVDGAKVILNLPRPTGRNGESPWHVDFTKKSDSSATDCQGLRFCVHQRHQMMTSKMLEELQENLSKSFKITLQKLGNHIRAHDEGNPRVILREPLPRSLSSPFHCSGRHTDADKEGCQGRSQLRSEDKDNSCCPHGNKK